MKINRFLLLFVLMVSIYKNVKAETWNEPWQKEIIMKSDYFILGKVISNIDSLGVEIEVIKHFGKNKISGKLLINGFSQLQLMSSSGHGLHLNFAKDQIFYLLLKKKKDGNYAIPTPTSGYALLDEDNNVYATYRHSYHQALIPKSIYEKTYSEIWSYYKEGTFNRKNIIDFINKNIDKKPAGFNEAEISTFFLQHAAMETAYLLDLEINLNRLKKFIEFDNFHSKVSALQLLGNTKKKEALNYLFNYIINNENKNFEKVIAIWALCKTGKNKYKKKLIEIKEHLSDESTSFGGNIMDPRVGTHFPSPRRAIEEIK